MNLNIKNPRRPNFPETNSEFIVKCIIEKIEHIEIIYPDAGDLEYKHTGIKIKVKCYSSSGPSSFGPKTKWDILYLLDASNYLNDVIICYKINLASSSDVWQNTNLSQDNKYKTHANNGKRPRNNPIKILQQTKNYTTIIYEGSIKTLLSMKSNFD